MDWSPPGSSVHGLSQARILEWVPASFVINSHPVCTAGHSGQYLLGNRAVTPGRGALPGARAKAVKALLPPLPHSTLKDSPPGPEEVSVCLLTAPHCQPGTCSPRSWGWGIPRPLLCSSQSFCSACGTVSRA